MTVPMLMMPPPMARTRYADWPFAVKSILGFWMFYALTIVVRAVLTADPWTMVRNKLLYLGVGVIIKLREELLEHYNEREPIGMRLNWLLTILGSVVYFQFALNRIARQKEAAREMAPLESERSVTA